MSRGSRCELGSGKPERAGPTISSYGRGEVHPRSNCTRMSKTRQGPSARSATSLRDTRGDHSRRLSNVSRSRSRLTATEGWGASIVEKSGWIDKEDVARRGEPNREFVSGRSNRRFPRDSTPTTDLARDLGQDDRCQKA